MKNLLISTFLVLSVFQSFAQKNKKDQTAIMANFAEQERSWSAHDLEAYVKAYHQSSETKAIGSKGVTYGVDNILANYKKNYTAENMGRLFFDNYILEKLSPKCYYVIGRFNLDYGKDNDLRQGHFSVIMKKINGEWLIVSDHSS
jgi:D-alanyl-D-alanine carboxypeptidase